MVGASGAVVGVVMLYALSFPHRTVLLFFVIPAPAWVMGALLTWPTWPCLWGCNRPAAAANRSPWGVHLAGAALAYLYYRFHWNLGRLVPAGFSLDWLKPRSTLHVHDPEQDEPQEPDLGTEVKPILGEEIHREGEAQPDAKRAANPRRCQPPIPTQAQVRGGRGRIRRPGRSAGGFRIGDSTSVTFRSAKAALCWIIPPQVACF